MAEAGTPTRGKWAGVPYLPTDSERFLEVQLASAKRTVGYMRKVVRNLMFSVEGADVLEELDRKSQAAMARITYAAKIVDESQFMLSDAFWLSLKTEDEIKEQRQRMDAAGAKIYFSLLELCENFGKFREIWEPALLAIEEEKEDEGDEER